MMILILPLTIVPLTAEAKDDSAQSREYKIKAAFLYNFIKFVDWPEEKTSDSNEPIIISIIGKDPFGRVFEPIKNKKVKNRIVVIKRFKSFEAIQKLGEHGRAEFDRNINYLRKCHLLFVCSSEKDKVKEVLALVKDHSVLTVADTRGFLESGGIINFLMEDKKVRFEINVAAAKKSKLKISSKLLRLAKRVVKEKSPQQEKG
ncbi:MAG: YfiR family protein [Planctomycetes bacterium]|nr:YfiR family protein [Planctomycetota bacterium]